MHVVVNGSKYIFLGDVLRDKLVNTLLYSLLELPCIGALIHEPGKCRIIYKLGNAVILRGLALAELGRKNDAKALFEGMLAFAEKGLATPFKIDYFATSLPLLLIFDDDLEAVKNERMRNLISLAEKGLRLDIRV